ncbi:sucrase ferredoxin [Corynebacterium aquatimens]|uniref:Sucrase ferredoxin n=1 Tax=Corynebacterium aquatimens TaxID=1190508 RepID=A0A931E2K2_9CORY|nr:sucrase ferredoxin [Corynebacterium aquatimens]MBG6123083.1 hypothetical protein [Corynebacterium aquatimens]WJY66583.1 Sucrase/ferredoxin-like protein [Corynebacterium aquatimens]
MAGIPRQLCSDVEVEPLPGTAKKARFYVLFEWPGPWSRDVLDGGTFGEELSAKLKAHMDAHGAAFQLIRHPTREGRAITRHRVYLVFPELGITEGLFVDKPEALLDLDLTGPGKNRAQTRMAPLVLVCTHAKRDRCCAIKGRPLVKELDKRYPFASTGEVVWESSHVKGHRFAAAMLLMPWGYSFGRMNLEATEAMIAAAMRGQMFVPGNRGNGLLPAPAQVAELAVAQHLQLAGEDVAYGQLSLVSCEQGDGKATVVMRCGATGRKFELFLSTKPAHGVISSCGGVPKEATYWQVDDLQITGA